MPTETKPNKALATVLDIIGFVLFAGGGLAVVAGPLFDILNKLVTSSILELTGKDVVLGILGIATMAIGIKAGDKAQDIRNSYNPET